MFIVDTLRNTEGAGAGCRRRNVEQGGRNAKHCREGAEPLEQTPDFSSLVRVGVLASSRGGVSLHDRVVNLPAFTGAS
jgi:hypothetical protein